MYKLSNFAAEYFAFIYMLNFGILQADDDTDGLDGTLYLLSSSPLRGSSNETVHIDLDDGSIVSDVYRNKC